MIRKDNISPDPKATLKRRMMIPITIMIQINTLITIIDTSSPLLNLLSAQSLRNSTELFFFMMMAHKNGDMIRRTRTKLSRLPFIPGIRPITRGYA